MACPTHLVDQGVWDIGYSYEYPPMRVLIGEYPCPTHISLSMCVWDKGTLLCVGQGSFPRPPVPLTGRGQGHGTHVCGTALGELDASAPSAGPRAFNGGAPGAKLAFDDISAGGEALQPPADLNAGLFPHSYAAGARVYSMSWGSEVPVYDSEAMEVANGALAQR